MKLNAKQPPPTVLTIIYDYGTMTMVMITTVSKSQFKSQALEYLREVEKKNQPLIITHAGKAVAKVIPYKATSNLQELRGTVSSYIDPTEPVGDKDWEVFK